MTDPNTDCPSRWSSLTEGSKRSCGRVVFGQYICYSVFFSVSGGPYNQVCGRIRAYQKGLPSAYNLNGKTSVDDAYIYTSVVCLYCMAVLDNTSGSLLQEGGVSITVRVTLLLTHCTSHHLWERIRYFCESGYVYPGVHDYL